MKRVILCADDYGQNVPISQGIIALLAQKKLSAVSCLVTSHYWLEHAEWLQPFRGAVDIGLHFNLTEGRALSKAYIDRYGPIFLPLEKVVLRAYLRQFDAEVLAEECRAQWDAFHAGIGRPDFLDGHQHVHQLPIIREAIIRVYQERSPDRKVYVRNIAMRRLGLSAPALIKRLIIQALGAGALKKRLSIASIPCNSSFAGVYSFGAQEDYSRCFPKFLALVQDHGLIMCHPALAPENEADAIGQARFNEYKYFMGNGFQQHCTAKKTSLSRF